MAKVHPEKGKIELAAVKQNLTAAGVDEVGRGCLAGPVVTATVILDYKKLYELDSKSLELIRDSKSLSHNQRSKIIPVLDSVIIAKSLGSADAREIEKFGILKATFLAMQRSIAGIDVAIDLLLVDGNQAIPYYKGEQKTVVKGDSLCFAIAAASIYAKEERDAFMRIQSDIYPSYGFDSHVGYGTKKHLEALESDGICVLHRKNFAPISSMVQS